MSSRRSLVLALFAALPTTMASAEEPEHPGSSHVSGQDEIQVTATRLEEDPLRVPVAVDVVDAEEIRAHQPEVLPDALRGEPGVHVQLTTPGQGSAFVRGLTGSSILNLVDGMRLNHAIYRNSPNPYLALVDPWLVERIEVVHGPASVLYGSDAMGGVIHVLTRRPHFESDTWDARGRIAGRFSSADLAGAGRAELEAGRERVGFGAGFSYLEADDLRGGGHVGRQKPTDYSSIGGDARAEVEALDGHTTSLDFQVLRQPRSHRYDELVPGFGRDAPPNDVFAFEPLERSFWHGRHEIDAPAPGIVDAVRFDAGFQHIRDDQRTIPFEDTTERREDNSTALLGFTAQATTLASSRLSLVWGGEAYLDEVSSRRLDVDLETGEASPGTPRFPDGSQMDSFGLYLEGTYEIAPSLAATAGMRGSHFDVRVARTETTDGEVLSFDNVTGAVGLAWEALPDFYLMSNAGRGFRAPNVFDLGTLGPRPGNRFNVPAENLDPEVIYTVDLGVKAACERVRGSVFVYGSLYEDRIATVRTGEVTEDGRDVTTSANLAEVRLAGVEAASELDIVHDVTLDAHVAWSWGEQRADGDKQPADRILPILGRVGVRWDATETVWVEPFVRFASRQDRLSDDNKADPRIDPDGTPGWITGNVAAGWDVDEHLNATLAVENFTDAAYREHGSGVVAAGVDVIATVEARF